MTVQKHVVSAIVMYDETKYSKLCVLNMITYGMDFQCRKCPCMYYKSVLEAHCIALQARKVLK